MFSLLSCPPHILFLIIDQHRHPHPASVAAEGAMGMAAATWATEVAMPTPGDGAMATEAMARGRRRHRHGLTMMATSTTEATMAVRRQTTGWRDDEFSVGPSVACYGPKENASGRNGHTLNA